MKVKDFFKWADEEFKVEMELMRVKGKEYTVSDEDKLKNFKFLFKAFPVLSSSENSIE